MLFRSVAPVPESPEIAPEAPAVEAKLPPVTAMRLAAVLPVAEAATALLATDTLAVVSACWN